MEIGFTAVHEREFLFRLKCGISKSLVPLILNVKTEGYAVQFGVSVISADGQEMKMPLDRHAERIIDFKEVSTVQCTLVGS